MLLTLHTLPQLAVSAKILCLLMVVICGAVPSMVRSVRLYSQCSSGFLRIYPNGTVMAKGSDFTDQYQNLTISSEDFDLKLLIYAPEVRQYLCFNPRWKLVGLPISKRTALRQARCQFREDMSDAYNTYRSVANSSRFVAINPHGLQPVGRKANARIMRKCRGFLKMDLSFSIAAHNNKVAGDGQTHHQQQQKQKQQQQQQQQQQHHYPPPKKAGSRCRPLSSKAKVRHAHLRHGHQRRPKPRPRDCENEP